MGRKPGSKNKPKENLEDLNVDFSESPKVKKQDQDAEQEEKQDTDDDIIVFDVNEPKYERLFKQFGVRVSNDLRNVEIFRREYYNEDKDFRVVKTGETITYKAGTYGSWDKKNVVYLNSLPSAIDFIAKKVFEKKFRENKTFVGLKEMANEIRDLLTNIMEIK